ncbi:hypothetical protein ILUMI_18730, partial [Ignelater luminosus]
MPFSREEWRKPLSQKELEEAILHLSEGEDDLEIFSDDDDLNFDENVLITHVTADSDENIYFELPNIENIDIENIPTIFEDEVIPSSTSLPNMLENLEPEQAQKGIEIRTTPTNGKKKRILKEPHQIQVTPRSKRLRKEIKVKSSEDSKKIKTSNEVQKLKKNIDFFDLIAQQSTLYATQIASENQCFISFVDIKKYIGVCIMMSVVHMPSIRRYWSKSIGMDSIKQAMPQKHFEKVRRYLHFNDNSEMLPREDSNHDRLYKLRPVINHLLEKYQSIPYEKDLLVDEQICYTKAR